MSMNNYICVLGASGLGCIISFVINKNVKDVLEARRAELGISQEVLAERSGISQTLYSDLATGRKDPLSLKSRTLGFFLAALEWDLATFSAQTGIEFNAYMLPQADVKHIPTFSLKTGEVVPSVLTINDSSSDKAFVIENGLRKITFLLNSKASPVDGQRVLLKKCIGSQQTAAVINGLLVTPEGAEKLELDNIHGVIIKEIIE